MQWTNDNTKESLASLSAFWQGYSLRGIQKITFTEELSRDAIYGNSSVSIGVPVGQHKAEGSLQVLSQEADNLRGVLGPNFGATPGTISYSLFEPLGAGILTYTATRVYLVKLEVDLGEAGGAKPSLETFSLIILDPIDWGNGTQIVTDQSASGFVLQLPTISIGI